jgi:hypothetical protein
MSGIQILMMFASQSRIADRLALGHPPFLTSPLTRECILLVLAEGNHTVEAVSFELPLHSKQHNSPSTNVIKYYSDFQTTLISSYLISSKIKTLLL